jgi:hypothetical protein
LIYSLRCRWYHFWFEAVPADNLGLCRMILFGSVFLYYVLTPWFSPSWGYLQEFSSWGSVSRVFWKPVWLISILHLAPASPQVLEAIQLAWRAALLFSCVGLLTRISTFASFALSIYLIGLPASFGGYHHPELVLIFSFLIMAISRCGDAWSVDARIRKARAGGWMPPAPSGEYTWPVRMIWFVLVLIYFAAGLSKVRHAGFEWIASDTLRHYLIANQYHVAMADPLTSLGQTIGHWVIIPRLLAALTMFLELASPIALFRPRFRWVLVPGLIVMHVGIAAVLGAIFFQIVLCQLMWVPWDLVAARVARRKPDTI